MRIKIPLNWDQLRGNLPSPLKRLILKCLRVKVEERPAIGDLLEDEYIAKLFENTDGAKYYSKSVVSKVTACTEGSLLESVKFSGGNIKMEEKEEEREIEVKGVDIGKTLRELKE